MIKFTAKGKDRQLVGLGITERNIEELKKGKPIFVKLKDVGIEGGIEISIFFGHDERTLFEEIKPFLGPETKVKGDIPVDKDSGAN